MNRDKTQGSEAFPPHSGVPPEAASLHRMSATPEDPQGIGGWLIIPATSLIIGVVLILPGFFSVSLFTIPSEPLSLALHIAYALQASLTLLVAILFFLKLRATIPAMTTLILLVTLTKALDVVYLWHISASTISNVIL